MEKINSINKSLIIIFTLILMQTFSFAQTKLAVLKDGTVYKAATQSYKVKKTTKYIELENILNKFSNVKQNSPRLYGQVLTKPDIVIDMAKLGKICAKYISRNQLEILAGGIKYAGLMIDIRTDINGNTLEVAFFTNQNSILTLNQLEIIEKEIMLTKLVSMKPEILPLLEGSNFWLVWPKIDFEDMLKIKLKMEASEQKETN